MEEPQESQIIRLIDPGAWVDIEIRVLSRLNATQRHKGLCGTT